MTTPSKISSSSSSSSKKSTTTTQQQPPWASRNLMRVAGSKKRYKDDPNDDDADDDDAEAPAEQHSLPLPEEARTTAAVADATNHGGKTTTSLSKRRVMMMTACALAMVLIISLSIAIAAKRKDEEGGAASSRASKKDDGGIVAASGVRDPDLDVGQNNERLRSVVQFLQVYSHPQDLETLDTPQNKAAKWLANTDENAMLDIPVTTHYQDAFDFVQRYIVAVLYYSTSGDDSWTHSDLGFLSGDSVCEWNVDKQITIRNVELEETVVMRNVGAACDDYGQVNYIYLPENGLVGTLPTKELGLLEAMDHFSIVDNQVSGPLPESLKEWKDIRILALEGNKISGPLPSYLSTFNKLEFAHLAHNAFTGTIPTLTNLTSLKDFTANDNQLTGSMATFFHMTSLETLSLRNNQLTGKLTDDVFLHASHLNILDLGGNLLSGSIPVHFYDIPTVSLQQNQLTGPLPVIDRDDYEVQFLNLHGNALSGELPQNMGDLSQLTHLDVSMNNFTGRIPSESLNTLSNLIYLYLGDNGYSEHHFPVVFALEYLQELSVRNSNLIGAIPSWVGTSLLSLQFLDASHNHLNDTIPYELGDLETLRFLMLDHNQLSGMVPTSFPQLLHLHVLTLSQNDLIGGLKPICEDGIGPQFLDLLVVDCEVHSSCGCCSYCCAAGSEATCLTASFSPNVNNTYERDVFVFPSEGLSYNPHQLQQDASAADKASN